MPSCSYPSFSGTYPLITASLILPSIIVIFAFILALLYYCSTKSQSPYAHLPLPPGPRGNFLTGVDLAAYMRNSEFREPWKLYAEWGRVYGGPIQSYRIHTQHTIILSSYKAIRALLTSRSAIYSDRPYSVMYHGLSGRANSVFAVGTTNERHSAYRKVLKQHFGDGEGEGKAGGEWTGVLEAEVDTLIQGLQDGSSNWERCLRRNTAAVIMKIAFGYNVTDNDHFISVAEEAAKISGWALAPGRWLVDYYPTLRYIPSWFPGAHFKKQGERWRERLDSLSGVPHEWVKAQMASGHYTESFTSRLLRPDGVTYVSPVEDDTIKWCAGGLYAGATDTIVSALMSFILLMALHPSVQRRAQAEIDDLVGSQEPPRTRDVKALSRGYLLAVLKEILRYAPVANLALPHRVTEEDEYEGYRIPAGANVIANVWAVMHDPELYPDPFTFDPDRFVHSFVVESKDIAENDINPDPRSWAYGFGRRTCPGLQFAESSMLLSMSNILAKFDIRPKSKEPQKIEFTPGITSHIKPFDIEITPRRSGP